MKTKIILPLIGLCTLLFITCRHQPNDIPLPSNANNNNGNNNNNNNGNAKDSVCFAEEVLPLLVSYCAKSGCHDAITHAEGLRLNSYANVMSSISGNSLIHSLHTTGSDAMPPLSSGPALTSAQINLIQTWVNQGMQNGIDCTCTIDTNNVTFSATIFPIFQSQCLGCHSSSLPILTNYSYIKYQVDTGRLTHSINHTNGVIPMPLNSSQLSACKLAAYNKWVNSGAPNN